MKHYRSSIPKAARERVIATFASGPQKFKVECQLKGKVVGIRYYHETGELEQEYPLKNGVTHGIVYRADKPGTVTSAEPYRNGLPHGTARQWSHEGELIGGYTMKHGTGLDLWWSQLGNRSPFLAEARYIKDGKWHGFEWWFMGSQIWQERHFWSDRQHGIERHWKLHGRLRRGYPRYWVNGERTTKPKYIRACANDASLPPFREQDNRPRRILPAEIEVHRSGRRLKKS